MFTCDCFVARLECSHGRETNMPICARVQRFKCDFTLNSTRRQHGGPKRYQHSVLHVYHFIVLLHCPIPVCFLTHLSALHLAPAVAVLQLQQSETLSFSSSLNVYHTSPDTCRHHPNFSRPSSCVSCVSDSAFADNCAQLQNIFSQLVPYLGLRDM